MNKEFLAGMVLSATGKTSHTAILARSLGIPTLTDIDFSTLQLNTEMDIIIDGNPGILIIARMRKSCAITRMKLPFSRVCSNRCWLMSIRQRPPAIITALR
ncbi:PEP-utilizing enzyme [Klebsiella quasipneumoniae]|uniref:PEP-utilizing enzyme n=1 Tax=Klebsiella quasipneumoniae TaxID=1463165 RepID=UPI0022286DF1|nr:PEP-utilizing enzyme [Klebsiella quasipneumoniae]